MSGLDPAKLHVRLQSWQSIDRHTLPRRYTLTHSDRTGDLFLTIARDYDYKQISGWYTRMMRDEVLAEWTDTPTGPALDVHCHVSGGLAIGSAAWRYGIFQQHLKLVLQSFRQGDGELLASQPELDQAPVRVHFHSQNPEFNRIELWGTLGLYALGRSEPSHVSAVSTRS